MKNIACVYHIADNDGRASAAIVKHFFSSSQKSSTQIIDFIGWDYDMEIPILDAYDTVIICDLAFPYNIMKKLNKKSKLIWIDHHEAAINKMKDLMIEGNRSKDLSAAELTWLYFFPTKQVPQLIDVVGKVDTFRHIHEKEATTLLQIDYGLRTVAKTYIDMYEYLTEWAVSDKQELKEIGANVLSYLQTKFSGYIDSGIDLILPYKGQDLKTKCINSLEFNPNIFGYDFDLFGYDAFLTYQMSTDLYKFTLYTNDKVNAADFAISMGGGGHPKVAGFSVSMESIGEFFQKFKN